MRIQKSYTRNNRKLCFAEQQSAHQCDVEQLCVRIQICSVFLPPSSRRENASPRANMAIIAFATTDFFLFCVYAFLEIV